MSTPAELAAAEAVPSKRAASQQWVTTLRECRVALKLRLRQVASRLGISLGHLSSLELGACAPSLELAFHLAAFYGKPITALWVRRLDGGHLLPKG